MLDARSSCSPAAPTPSTPAATTSRSGRDRLRHVEAIDLANLSATPPSTGPAPQPASRPTTGPVPPPARPQTRPAPTEVRLTLDDVRRLALRNNLDLRVELLNPTIARTNVSEEEARFEAVFTTSLDYAKFDAPTGSRLNSSQGESLAVTPGIDVPLITGGTIRLAAPLNRTETNNEFTFLNPSYETDAAATISQPLLRGGGADVTYNAIRIARYEYQATQARTKLEVIRVLAEADRTYWRLYAARRDLELRQQEYRLAEAQLARARRQAAAGVVAEVDIVRAESGLADRQEAIIEANNVLRDRQRELKRILNAPDLDLAGPEVLIPGSRPVAVYYEIDADRLVGAALAGRMEMLELELQIAAETANVRAARNATLPLATLDYTYNVNGLGPTWGESLDVTRDVDFEDHRVGLRVEVPIGNGVARARLRRALLGRMQALASREQRAALVRQEVYVTVDNLDANWQRILANRLRVTLAARVLDAEIRQFNLGLRTSTDVLDAQTRLADAQASEISAVTDYQIAQVDLAFATGTLLGAAHVEWVPAGEGREAR